MRPIQDRLRAVSGTLRELSPSKATVRIPAKHTPAVRGCASGPATISNSSRSGAGPSRRRRSRSTRVAQLANDNQFSLSTAYRYLHEPIDVLAAASHRQGAAEPRPGPWIQAELTPASTARLATSSTTTSPVNPGVHQRFTHATSRATPENQYCDY